MASFRLDIDWLAGDIDGEIKPKFWREGHVLRYGPSTDLDQMYNIEDLVVKALHDDDESYKTIQYVLNNSSPRSLEIQWVEQDQSCFEQQWITTEQMQILADSLTNNKALQSFIFNDKNISYIGNKQTMEILAKGINGSILKFVGFVSLPEFIMDTLFNTLSTNYTLRQLYLKSSTGLGSRLDNFILSSNITKLHLLQIVLNDSGIESMKNILTNTKTLETLELRRFELRTLFKNFNDLCSGIKENRSLKTLIIGSTVLLVENNITALITALKSHPTIDSLNIQELNSHKFDLITTNLLGDDSTLTSISINKPTSDNVSLQPFNGEESELYLTSQALRNFGEVLAANTKLQHLFLGTIIDFNGAAKNESILLNALKLNRHLLTLDLLLYSHDAIIQVLQHNTSLTKLIVKKNAIWDAAKFFTAIRQHKNLTSLDISYLDYGFTSTDEIFGVELHDLIVNSRLRELKCSHPTNRSAYFSIPSLLSSLKYNDSLTSVELLTANKTRRLLDFNFVADVFAVNKTLIHLNTNIQEKVIIEPYLKKNRGYQLDAIILAYNVVRSEHATMFPNEIWLQIFSHIGTFYKAIDIVFYGKQNKRS